MTYDPRAYVPGGSKLAVAKAIQAKGLTSTAGKTGTVAKVVAPQIGSPSWLAGASSADLAGYMSSIQPDYSGVPTVDPQAAADYAKAGAADWLKTATAPITQARDSLAAQKSVSLQAGTNFTQALANILTGGLSGQEGRDYALKTFGGSFLAEVQTVEGQKMMQDLSRDFSTQDNALLQKISDLATQSADVYDKLYTDVYNSQVDAAKQGLSIAQQSWDNRIKIASLLLSNAQKTEAQKATTARNNADNAARAALAAAKAGGNANVTYVTQPGGGVIGFDKKTGKRVYSFAGTGPVGGSGGTPSANNITKTKTYKGAQGMGVYQWNPATNGYTTFLGKASTGSSSSGGVTPSTTSTTIARAEGVGKDVLTALMNRIAAKVGPNPKEGSTAAGVAAIKDRSFLTAMTLVTKAIAPHLKTINYTPAQIKAEAYRLITQVGDSGGITLKPPTGYKVPTAPAPKATNASFTRTLEGAQFAKHTSPPPSDDVVYALYKSSPPISDEQLAQVLMQAGFQGQGLQIAYSIAKRESGANPLAFNPNRATGDRSWGLFQINTLGKMKGRLRQFGLKSEMQLLDPLTNAKAAFRMSGGGTSFGAWGYGSNAYRDVPLQILPLPGTT